MLFSAPEWQQRRALKQGQRDSDLRLGNKVIEALKNGYQSDIEGDLPFLSATAAEIVANIGARREGWTAVRVLAAFIRSATRAQGKTNCLTEIMFVKAFERAKELDALFSRTGELVGPLHGVPMSLKDQFDFEGVDTTIGFTHDIQKPAKAHSSLAAILIAAGGVPFVKTNVPQTMLAFECANPLFGVSLNPYNPAHVPGGSSGGEGALLGSDGSPLGYGSDVGGSLRIPAHYSGCWGLKPCYGRIPNRGARASNAGFEAIRNTMGPMGRSHADLELGFKVVVDAAVKNAKIDGLLPIPWKEVELPERLKFGYYVDDGFCKASPVCARAVLESVAALEKAGHEVVLISPPEPGPAFEIFGALTSAGGYRTLLRGLQGDPHEPAIFLTTLGPKLPWFVRHLLAFIIRNLAGDEILADAVLANREKTVDELQGWLYKRNEYIQSQRDELWGNLALDGIICPVQALPAVTHNSTRALSPLAVATFIYNLIDSAVGVLPVTFVDPVKDALPKDWLEGTKGSPVAQKAVYGAKGAYDAEMMSGLPVGVQVVAGSWEEEKCLAMMKVLDDALGERGFGPGRYAQKQARA